MALNPLVAQCTTCGVTNKITPVRSFLGFQKFACPDCGNQHIYPLTSGYRTIYTLLAAIAVLKVLGSFMQGTTWVPGIFALVAIFVLLKDYGIRKQTPPESASETPTQPSDDRWAE
jgi:predicted RNA-binding Zn-ribbon protein involved in translation (DUF1610 family)